MIKQYIRLSEAVEYNIENNLPRADDHKIENVVIPPDFEALLETITR